MNAPQYIPITATRLSDGEMLEIDLASSRIVHSAGFVTIPIREAMLCYLLFAAVPAVVSYDRIKQAILDPAEISPDDPGAYIRKLKLNLTKTLSKILGSEDIIVSVRGVGYKLIEDWSVTHRALIEEVATSFVAIRDLVPECLGVVGEALLEVDDNGDRAARGDPVRVEELVRSFDLAASAIRNAVTMGAIDARIATLLADIRSYFALSRSGQVEEQIWRSLFQSELVEKVRILGRLLSNEA